LSVISIETLHPSTLATSIIGPLIYFVTRLNFGVCSSAATDPAATHATIFAALAIFQIDMTIAPDSNVGMGTPNIIISKQAH